MRFDYFLKTKSLNNILKRLKNSTVKTTIPISTRNKLSYDLVNQVDRDRFLYDYTKAFYDEFVEPVVEEKLFDFEFCLLLFLEKKINYSFFEVLYTFKNIKKGKRPETEIENLIYNTIYAYEFIKMPKIVLDENNFEMFVHILLQNLDFDLDIKANYYRSPTDKTIVENSLSANDIDSEFNALFDYLKDMDSKMLSGYTQAYILFIMLMLISPFKSYNLTFSTLFTQWFSFQRNESKKIVIPLYQIAKNWNNFNDNINNLINEELNVNQTLNTIKHCYIENINFYYHASHIYKWILKDRKKRMWIFEDDQTFILLVLMLQKTENLSLSSIKNLLTVNKIKLLSDQELKKILDKLINKNVIQKIGNQTIKYSFYDKDLEKARFLVK
ncbi:hypothetical protein [Mycoplasma sp. HU2014]|uniref:hypothetical protein n=1 Tax=Mycoplasma sp. HU2014 TaxID=1664275 RepID=UPI00067B3184|nr:hypothetical protein [Mycoplasma sp. HU2014]KNG79147.1 hypothetical protein AB668_03925 [Mycoplasma sp. HU2014]